MFKGLANPCGNKGKQGEEKAEGRAVEKDGELKGARAVRKGRGSRQIEYTGREPPREPASH